MAVKINEVYKNRKGEEIRIKNVTTLTNSGEIIVNYHFKRQGQPVMSGNTTEEAIEKTIKQGGFTKDSLDRAIKASDDGRENEIRKIAAGYMKKKNYKSPKIVDYVVALYEDSAWSSNVLKEKVMKEIDQIAKTYDATSIIAQKNGYILAVNREGTVVLAFPGEDPNSNPHMYLGKADKAGNIEAGKRMLYKMADAATCDATYKVTYKYEGSIDRRFAYVKAANEEQAKQKCLKEHTDRMRNARIIDILKMQDAGCNNPLDKAIEALDKDEKTIDGKTYNYENPRSLSFIFSNFMAVAKSGDTLNIKFKGNLITISKRQGGDYGIAYGNVKKSGTDTQIMSILKDLQSTKDAALKIDPITGFLVRDAKDHMN